MVADPDQRGLSTHLRRVLVVVSQPPEVKPKNIHQANYLYRLSPARTECVTVRRSGCSRRASERRGTEDREPEGGPPALWCRPSLGWVRGFPADQYAGQGASWQGRPTARDLCAGFRPSRANARPPVLPNLFQRGIARVTRNPDVLEDFFEHGETNALARGEESPLSARGERYVVRPRAEDRLTCRAEAREWSPLFPWLPPSAQPWIVHAWPE